MVKPKEHWYGDRQVDLPLAGTQFNEWTYVSANSTGYRWRCRCSCGTVREVVAQDLRTGRSKSCGHGGRSAGAATAAGAANKTHGVGYESKLYRTWRNAKNRCFNPKATKFPRYGDRGITMHPAWAASFEKFAAAVGEPPSPLHSLDREKNDKGYVPGNVRWATALEQAANCSTTRRVKIGRQTKTIRAWVEHYGTESLSLARSRLNSGWEPLRAFTEPKRKTNK